MKNIRSLFVLPSVFFLCGCVIKDPAPVSLRTYSIHTDKQQEYLDAESYETIDADGVHHLDKPNPVTFRISNYREEFKYKVYYSYEHSYEDPKIRKEAYVIPNEDKVTIKNLELGKTYYFQVAANGVTVQQGTFNTSPGIIRNLEVDGMKNVRDMGGYETSLGYFKPNMIYRTSELNNSVMDGENDSYITDLGAETMINDLKIKTEIDLRMIDEEDIPTEYKEESILKVKYGADVKLYQLNINYNGLTILSSTENEHIKQFFEAASDINNYPICFHCHIGTDRTGMFAAAIHSLLGCDEEHIYRDYMFSNFAYIGGSRSIDGINNSYMNDLNSSTGSTIAEKAYNLLHNQVGVPTNQLDNIRNILLER